jgi:uncharacterized protein (TIGR02099 family)
VSPTTDAAPIDAAGPAADATGRRWLRAAAIAGACLLIAAALLVLALRIVLAGMPERADKVQAWVERQTQLRLQFSSLDARLRWYGPEVVLRDLRILDRDDRQALLAMREGSVALDLWNVLRTGEFVAGRVSFTGPTLTVLRLEDGSIRLLGLGERPADQPPFDLDRLPAGRVRIADATVHMHDLRSGAAPWTIRDLDVALRRDRRRIVAIGSARLPESMGTRIGIDAELDGSLAQPDQLAGRVTLNAERLELAGLAGLLPAQFARPLAGTGHLEATIAFAARRLTDLRLDLDLRNLALRLPPRSLPAIEVLELAPPRREPGSSALRLASVEKRWVQEPAAVPATISYGALVGKFRLRNLGDGWAFEVRDLRVAREPRASVAAANLRGEFRGRLVTRHALTLEASRVQLEDAWPLALAFAPRSADRWLGLAPQGEIRKLSLKLDRPRAGAVPVFDVSADLVNLGAAASGPWPGLRGMTASLVGTDRRGRIALRSPGIEFAWPRVFQERLGPVAVAADLDWRREGRTWTLGGERISLRHPLAAARGGFELQYSGRKDSPVLRMDATVDEADVALVRRLIPYGRLKPRSTAWLQRAFVQGTAVKGVIHYDGPVRRFPFRDGGGDFRVAFDVRDTTLDYFEGFTPLTGASGQVEIHNGGLRATLGAGRVGGLRLTEGAVEIADLKAPVIEVDASGEGDLGSALVLLQGSPIGPRIGRQFMQLAGRGDTGFDLRLHLPTSDIDTHDYDVRTRFRSASLALPLLRVPVQDVNGSLEIRRREIRSDDLRGTFLGGPFTLTVDSSEAGAGMLDSVVVAGRGRAVGALLPAFISLPGSIHMAGGADWTLDLSTQRERQGEPWPVRLKVASDLRGLSIDAPLPFAKTADDARPTEVALITRPTGTSALEIRSGSARARLAFVERGGTQEFDRGALRFDDGDLSLPARPGLRIDGDWPDFDLGRWLALGRSGPGKRALSDWLGPVDVRLERAQLFGYQLSDVAAVLQASNDHWRVDVSGPQAAGRVTVPFDTTAGAPIVLDMQRLRLESAVPAAAAAAEGEGSTDPRKMPALTVSAEEFVWQGRRLGRLQAEVVREALGLRLRKFMTSSPELGIVGTGSWFVEGAGSRTQIEAEATSTDLAAATLALGYRDSIEAGHARATAQLSWAGGPMADAIRRMDGNVHVELDDGQLRHLEPGAAGRVLGLMSIVELPRRLALDFRDVTDEGLAFDSIRGDFELRKGNAYTQNLLLSGTAVDIGVAGRTGLASQDYDQTVVVSGNPGGPLTVAGALAAGPVVGAGVLVLSQLFKGQLQGLTRAYYHVTGPWSDPVVERISAPPEANAAAQEAARAALAP